MGPAPLLEVRDLSVSFGPGGALRAVDHVSLTVQPGESLGVVGESGSGKTAFWMAVMRLLRNREATVSGKVLLRGEDVLSASPRRLKEIRGREISMVFQAPLSALNPLHRVGAQIAEVFRVHEGSSRATAMSRAVDLLGEVGIPKPEQRALQYPHQFSGGMRQRVMIAIALALRPALLIADEATTALDVTVQAQVLDLLDRLRRETGAAVVFVTHDLGVVAERCDRVLVMYAGRPAELATRRQLFEDPQHPYTWGLLGSIPRIDLPASARLKPIPGQPPANGTPKQGCPFVARCLYSFDRCVEERPILMGEGGHTVACHLDIGTRSRLFRKDWKPTSLEIHA